MKNIPVIGNGDIITPQAAKKMFEETGCAGVSIGRGAFYDPWIFRRTLEYLQSSACGRTDRATDPARQLPPEPAFAERVRVMCRHLDLMIEVFGEELGCRMFRKVAPWYAKRFGPCHEFNKKVVQVSTRAEFLNVSGKLHPLAAAIPRRERRIAAALSSAADGRFLHARRAGINAARTDSRAERAGGGVVMSAFVY